MPRPKLPVYRLVCEKCGAEQIVHVPIVDAWHLKCPLKVVGRNAPRMRETPPDGPT